MRCQRMMAARKEEMWSLNNTISLAISPSLWQHQVMMMIFSVIKICSSLCKMVTWLLDRMVRWLLYRMVAFGQEGLDGFWTGLTIVFCGLCLAFWTGLLIVFCGQIVQVWPTIRIGVLYAPKTHMMILSIYMAVSKYLCCSNAPSYYIICNVSSPHPPIMGTCCQFFWA